MIGEQIEREIPNISSIEKEPPMLGQLSYIFRPDFVLKRDEKTFIIEAKDQVKPKDIALFEGKIMGLDAYPIIISYVNPDVNTTQLADELNIKLISGPPPEAIRKLEEVIRES